MSLNENYEREIENKFQIWNEGKQDLEVTNKSNEGLNKLFVNITYENNLIKDIAKINLDENLYPYLKNLKYAFENKFEVFVLNLKKRENFQNNLNFQNTQPILLAKVYFDKLNGGMSGLVHGGCIFSFLYLCILLYIDHLNKSNQICKYSTDNIITTYSKKVPVDTYMIIRVKTNEMNNQITAEMFDHEEKVYDLITCRIFNLDKVNKF